MTLNLRTFKITWTDTQFFFNGYLEVLAHPWSIFGAKVTIVVNGYDVTVYSSAVVQPTPSSPPHLLTQERPPQEFSEHTYCWVRHQSDGSEHSSPLSPTLPLLYRPLLILLLSLVLHWALALPGGGPPPCISLSKMSLMLSILAWMLAMTASI